MTADACREWRGALAAAALGHIDDAEAIALGAHLDGCRACRAELGELTLVARALPVADPARLGDNPAEPPAHLATDVVNRIASRRHRSRRRRTARLLAVAALLVVAFGFAAVVTLRGNDTPTATTVMFPAGEEATATARLAAHDEGTEVKLVASGLDQGDWYWLWLTGDNGKRVPAGTFRGTGHNAVRVTLTAALSLGDARRIWVTNAADKVILDARL
jgi:anti-sigma factor RsiW